MTIISTDTLFQCFYKMKSEPTLMADVADQLREVFRSEEYWRWKGGPTERIPFNLPAGIKTDCLAQVGLVSEGRLLVKINMPRSKICLTDGVWVDSSIRAFPFCDESETLLEHVESIGFTDDIDAIIDLATGCGHSLVACNTSKPRYGFDINPRALSFVLINRLFAGMSGMEMVAALNDIRDGIPDVLNSSHHSRVLFIANMPFAPAPSCKEVPLTTNGGRSGTDLQAATFRTIRDFAERTSSEVRASILGITPGNERENKWTLLDMAREYFAPSNISWTILRKEQLLRINGVRKFENPAPIFDALSELGSCSLYYKEKDIPRIRSAYESVARSLELEGCTDLAYGVVDIAFAPK